MAKLSIGLNDNLRSLIHSKHIRKVVVVIIILATIIVFGNYIHGHPDSLKTLARVDPLTICLLLLGYLGIVLSNAFVLHYSLLYLNKSTGILENTILTGYSSIVNFFGPLQSGPGVRAVYLKAKHHVKLRDFLLTTFIFYGFFALINLFILSIAWVKQFPYGLLSLIGAVALAAICIFIFAKVFASKWRTSMKFLERIRIKNPFFWMIALGAIFLTISTFFIYAIELNQVHPGYSSFQQLVYTATANLALFVSLTPGAIGFRESFLYFTEHLHGIDTNSILLASVIDRAINVLFLVLLFAVLLVLSGRKGLRSTVGSSKTTTSR